MCKLMAGCRTTPAHETVWSVVYEPQYHDEDNEAEGGRSDEEVTLHDLLEGVRLYKEFLRLQRLEDVKSPPKSASVNSPASVVVITTPISTTVLPERVRCKCLRSGHSGSYCLAKQQLSSIHA